MSNMSYCRFRNTLSDLRDCQNNLDDTDDLSREERRARWELIKLCRDIAEDCEGITEEEALKAPEADEDEEN